MLPRYAFLSLVLASLLVDPSALADTRRVAYDDASNYSDSTGGWTGNQGVGFNPWVFRAAGGGTFLAITPAGGGGNGDLNFIATGEQGWGTWANGGGREDSIAFRGFGWNGSTWTSALVSPYDRFRISMENGSIQQDNEAETGFALRNGNLDGAVANFDDGARFEFHFVGGRTNYYIVADGPEINTGIPFRDSGLDLEFMLTGTNTFLFTMHDAASGAFLTNIVGTLTGSGDIQSVALYNRDTESADVFFNKMEIIVDVPGLVLMAK